ncbi:hypothetical protein [Propionicicella superfundia]|uniref:hypothetical protein n=1 Tax=Propionicicella superfundia TaxID=348582 RepID=UPI0004181908|nr:hypothetical protein [Propionicicella superfundia]
MTLDNYPAAAKRLASSVTRLRGWVGSDPARQPELADELVRLTDERLDACAWVEAATDAQESVALSGRLLAAHGSFGPYTPADDAARFVHATVQLADTQAGLGLPDAAGASVATALAVLEQLPALDLVRDPRTRLRALVAQVAAALATGDAGGANTSADAAIVALDVTPGVPPLLALRVLSAVADARWAAGRREEGLAWSRAAVEHYRRSVDLSSPAKVNPTRLARLAERLHPTFAALSGRLADEGEVASALAVDREAVAALASLTARIPEATAWLGLAEAELATHLLAAGRPREAFDVAQDAAAHSPSDAAALAAGQALRAMGDPQGAVAELEPLVENGLSHGEVTGADATALAAYAEALAATGQDAAAIRAAAEQARAAVPVAAAVGSWDPPSGPFAASFDSQRLAALTARAVADLASSAPAARAAASRDEDDIRARAEHSYAAADAERAERERRLATERDAETARRAAEERAAAQAEDERMRAAEKAERQETKRRRQERIEQHRRDAEERDAEEREAALAAELARATDAAERERLELALLEQQLARLDRENAAIAVQEVPDPLALADEPAPPSPAQEPSAPAAELPATADTDVPTPAPAHEPPAPTAEDPTTPATTDTKEPTPTPAQGPPAPTAENPTTPATTDTKEPTPTPAQGPSGITVASPAPVTEPAAESLDPLVAARVERDAARSTGDRKALRRATEGLVEALRPAASADPGAFGAELVETLRESAALRLRAGDWWGSRGPAAEAKSLAKQWGLR